MNTKTNIYVSLYGHTKNKKINPNAHSNSFVKIPPCLVFVSLGMGETINIEEKDIIIISSTRRFHLNKHSQIIKEILMEDGNQTD